MQTSIVTYIEGANITLDMDAWLAYQNDWTVSVQMPTQECTADIGHQTFWYKNNSPFSAMDFSPQ